MFDFSGMDLFFVGAGFLPDLILTVAASKDLDLEGSRLFVLVGEIDLIPVLDLLLAVSFPRCGEKLFDRDTVGPLLGASPNDLVAFTPLFSELLDLLAFIPRLGSRFFDLRFDRF